MSDLKSVVVLTRRLNAGDPGSPHMHLALTAEERTRSRHRFEDLSGGPVFMLQLPRGTVLQQGDRLQSETGTIVLITAKPEPVLTVRANHPLSLLQAAYHLGNRHVPLEITPEYLRLAPDPVLSHLLVHRGLEVLEEIQPFQPEVGAYGHHHHSHPRQEEAS